MHYKPGKIMYKLLLAAFLLTSCSSTPRTESSTNDSFPQPGRPGLEEYRTNYNNPICGRNNNYLRHCIILPGEENKVEE